MVLYAIIFWLFTGYILGLISMFMFVRLGLKKGINEGIIAIKNDTGIWLHK